MSSRKIALVNDQYYHVFNRGVEKRVLFTNPHEYDHFLACCLYYLNTETKKPFSLIKEQDILPLIKIETSLVEIISFALLPNHYHLLVKQVTDGGISKFILRIQNSYSHYFNTKHQRVGPLFQGVFKAVRVESESQLLHLSRYVHLNPHVAGLSPTVDYQWSSYREFISPNAQFKCRLCNPSLILELLGDTDYKTFVETYADYAKELELIKSLDFE